MYLFLLFFCLAWVSRGPGSGAAEAAVLVSFVYSYGL